jgi:hypothetical protein
MNAGFKPLFKESSHIFLTHFRHPTVTQLIDAWNETMLLPLSPTLSHEGRGSCWLVMLPQGNRDEAKEQKFLRQ